MRFCRMCLNWRVIGGLAALSVIVLLVAPRAASAVLPVLVALACPLSMGAMMLGMGRGVGRMRSGSCSSEQAVDKGREERISQLEAEIASIRLQRPAATTTSEDAETGLRLS